MPSLNSRRRGFKEPASKKNAVSRSKLNRAVTAKSARRCPHGRAVITNSPPTKRVAKKSGPGWVSRAITRLDQNHHILRPHRHRRTADNDVAQTLVGGITPVKRSPLSVSAAAQARHDREGKWCPPPNRDFPRHRLLRHPPNSTLIGKTTADSEYEIDRASTKPYMSQPAREAGASTLRHRS